MKNFITVLLTTFLFTGCFGVNTSDPRKAYRYWAGTNPPADMELFNGEYWQSPHWSLEYIMYLELKPTNIWWDSFIEQNKMVPDRSEWEIPSDAPDWFKPSDSSVIFRIKDSVTYATDSRCFRDTLTGICYIYEIQL